MIERALPALAVLAYSEIPQTIQVRGTATISERGQS